MRSWILLVLITAILAGCASPDAEVQQAGPAGAEGAGTAEAGSAPMDAPAFETTSWQGTVTGAGADTLATGPVMAGSFTTQDSVYVRANATRIVFDVTLLGGASSDVFLRVWDPAGDGQSYGTLPDALPTDPIHVEVPTPAKGAWEAMLFLEGAGAEQEYEIQATVEYA